MGQQVAQQTSHESSCLQNGRYTCVHGLLGHLEQISLHPQVEDDRAGIEGMCATTVMAKKVWKRLVEQVIRPRFYLPGLKRLPVLDDFLTSPFCRGVGDHDIAIVLSPHKGRHRRHGSVPEDREEQSPPERLRPESCVHHESPHESVTKTET